MPAGYSGTPLAAKLGLKPGQRVWRDSMPASVAAEIGETGRSCSTHRKRVWTLPISSRPNAPGWRMIWPHSGDC